MGRTMSHNVRPIQTMARDLATLAYPLAIFSGLAVGSHEGAPKGPMAPVEVVSHQGGSQGASSQEAPRFGATSTPASPSLGSTPIQSRAGAESAELMALRLDEIQMFPELDPNQRAARPPVRVDDAAAPCAPGDEDCAAQPGVDGAQSFLSGLRMPEIPVPPHPWIRRYIHYFAETSTGRELMTKWLRRSGAYRELIVAQLEKRNLPKDLVAVPFIESGFWPSAVSPAGATGLWQLMPKTAAVYGLTVRESFDERRNVWRATEAATEHLRDLYDRFKAWDLALAAYNVGYQRIDSRMRDLGLEDFWALTKIEDALPRETDLYVPKILAVAVILNNLEHFGFSGIEYAAPVSGSPFEVPPGLSLAMLARATGTSVRYLKQLNPQLSGDTTPDLGAPVVLYVPPTGIARARVMLPELIARGDDSNPNVSPFFDWGHDEYDSKGRNRLERTGRGFFGTSVDSAPDGDPFARSTKRATDTGGHIVSATPLVAVGRSARVRPRNEAREEPPVLASAAPVASAASAAPPAASAPSTAEVQACEAPTPSTAEPSVGAAASAKTDDSESAMKRAARDAADGAVAQPDTGMMEVLYEVGRGDTVSEIGLAFGISEQALMQSNGMTRPSQLRAGRVLHLVVPKRSQLYYSVNRGDTVSEIAEQYRTNVEQITLDNRLRDPSLVRIGQRLMLRVPEDLNALASAR